MHAGAVYGMAVPSSRPDRLADYKNTSTLTYLSPLSIRTILIFTTLHAMQTGSSDEKAVCPSVHLSVCLSVKGVDCDKTEERSVQIFIPYERSFSLVF